jgi:hypothetical protein
MLKEHISCKVEYMVVLQRRWMNVSPLPPKSQWKFLSNPLSDLPNVIEHKISFIYQEELMPFI